MAFVDARISLESESTMKQSILVSLVVLSLSALCSAQSALDGVSFQASTYNLRSENVGTVRLTDVPGSTCRVEDGPLGDDVPGEECLTFDSGVPSVEITFNAGPQLVGDINVVPTATPFEGLEEPIEIFNLVNNETATTTAYASSGDLLEFLLVTTNRDQFPSADEVDYWGFSATGIQYPNATADSVVGLPFDEELGNFTNFYFWYEGKDGPLTEGYQVGLPVGLGVGRHPTDPDREVLYPLYSRGQADEQTDTVAGGSLDFYSHGSILDANPGVGNVLFLADNTVDFDTIDPLEDVVGFGLGVLVQAPEMEDVGPLCNPNTMGDVDGDGTVGFPDFLILSANFGQSVASHSEGDLDCSGDVQFADFLVLSANFGTTVASPASVPEPSSAILLVLAGCFCGFFRRRRAS